MSKYLMLSMCAFSLLCFGSPEGPNISSLSTKFSRHEKGNIFLSNGSVVVFGPQTYWLSEQGYQSGKQPNRVWYRSSEELWSITDTEVLRQAGFPEGSIALFRTSNVKTNARVFLVMENSLVIEGQIGKKGLIVLRCKECGTRTDEPLCTTEINCASCRTGNDPSGASGFYHKTRESRGGSGGRSPGQVEGNKNLGRYWE